MYARVGNCGVSGADGKEDKPNPDRLTGPVPRSTCLLPRISICGAKHTRCTAVTALQCRRPASHAYAVSNASSTAFPEYRVNIYIGQCHGRRAGSRLETCHAQAQVFPRAMTSPCRSKLVSTYAGKRTQKHFNVMLNLAMARQLASLRRGRPRRTPAGSTASGIHRSRQPAKCVTSVPFDRD